jgi:hypothetical protein
MAISGILSSQNHYNQRASGFWPTSVVLAISGIQKAIFGYGQSGSPLSVTNLVSNTGVVSVLCAWLVFEGKLYAAPS